MLPKTFIKPLRKRVDQSPSIHNRIDFKPVTVEVKTSYHNTYAMCLRGNSDKSPSGLIIIISIMIIMMILIIIIILMKITLVIIIIIIMILTICKRSIYRNKKNRQNNFVRKIWFTSSENPYWDIGSWWLAMQFHLKVILHNNCLRYLDITQKRGKE